MRKEWVLLFFAVLLVLMSAMFDPMLTLGLSIALLVFFAIFRSVQEHNQQVH
jgi:hypothetical protein